jgi:hypothetical protein
LNKIVLLKTSQAGVIAMKHIVSGSLLLLASTTSAFATAVAVPEIDAMSGLAAMGLVGSIATLFWERRRKK